MNNQTPPSAAPALDRGLSMIEYLLEINQPASLKKISDELSIPNTAVRLAVRYDVSHPFGNVGIEHHFVIPTSLVCHFDSFLLKQINDNML